MKNSWFPDLEIETQTYLRAWKAGGREKNSSFCPLVLIQISIKVVKQISLSAVISQGGWILLSICKVLGASVHPAGLPAFPEQHALFQDSSSMMTEYWAQLRAASHIQTICRNPEELTEVHQLNAPNQPYFGSGFFWWIFFWFWGLVFFWMKLFSWKIYERIFLTPCCIWQLPASSLTSVTFAFMFSAILS